MCIRDRCYPSCVEVDFWSGGFVPYPSSERLIGCLTLCLRLLCGWILCWLCLSSVRGCIRLREELCTPGYCIAQNLSGGSLCAKSCVDELVEILLCEGGDVELCARTSKHIRVFAFDPLFSNSLSLLYCALHWFILSYHIYMFGICLCVRILV